MLYHIIALTAGFILDRIIGDPWNLPHPIRLIGSLIGLLDHRFMDGRAGEKRRDPHAEFVAGVFMVFIVLLATGLCTALILSAAYRIHPYLGVTVESVLTCYILAAKSLKVESMKVCHALETGTIEEARYAVSMIVGRDTEALSAEGVTRAAVETVAENTSDGVIAPLIYTCIGGPVLGFLYKAVNTMDSMTGYHNDRYEYFGRAAAKLDDAVNFLPARVSALFMVAACFLAGPDFDGGEAWRIFKRDRMNHKSPNSAQTESVLAGALGVRLAGDAWYFGRLVKKPFIGDDRRRIKPGDIGRACRLMYLAELLAFFAGILLLLCVYFIFRGI